MLGHNNVSHNHEAIPLAGFLENSEKAVTAARMAKLGSSVITRAGDKVQVMGAVSTIQSGGHEIDQDHRTIIPRTRPCKERKDGAPTFQNGKEERALKRVGHPPIEVLVMVLVTRFVRSKSSENPGELHGSGNED